MITTDFTLYIEPTKKEIIERLFTAGHITFNEMWTLLQDDPTVKYVPLPAQQIPPPIDPWTPFRNPWDQPFTYTSDDTSNPRLHKFPRGANSPEQP